MVIGFFLFFVIFSRVVGFGRWVDFVCTLFFICVGVVLGEIFRGGIFGFKGKCIFKYSIYIFLVVYLYFWKILFLI